MTTKITITICQGLVQAICTNSQDVAAADITVIDIDGRRADPAKLKALSFAEKTTIKRAQEAVIPDYEGVPTDKQHKNVEFSQIWL